MLLQETLGSLTGRNAVVIGRSNLVGRPVAQLLLRADCTVTIAHSRTRDLPALGANDGLVLKFVGRGQRRAIEERARSAGSTTAA